MRRRLHRQATIATSLATLFAVGLPAVGEVPETTPDLVFGDVVDVRAINLEVAVRDRGRPVAGLGQQDFVLRVDGQPTAIEAFREVRASDPPGGALRRSLVVFVDDTSVVSADRNAVLRGLAGETGLLGAEDRLALVAFDGRQAETLAPWTRSADELAVALDRASERRAFGAMQRSTARLRGSPRRNRTGFGSSFSGISFSGSRELVDADGVSVSFSDQETRARIERMTSAARASMSALAAAPGRKLMLLLSSDWQPAERDEPVETLIDTANRLGFTLYPVDVPADADRDAERLGRASREPLLADPYDRLAQATGGRVLHGAVRTAALGRVLADTADYYWLGFSPAGAAGDARHRIEVEVRGGLEVRTRDSYRDAGWVP